MPLADVHAALLRVAQQEVVERRAGHLERLGGGGLGGFREVSVLLERAVERPEARAPLAHEARRIDRVVDAELPEDLVAPGELRLADVEAGELLSLQQEHAAP